MTTESFVATLALIGVVTLIAALLSGFIECSNVPQVAVFLGLGAIIGPAGLGLLDIGLDSPALRIVATLSLALVLFTDAVSLNIAEVRSAAPLALRVLGPGTILSAALIALAAWGLLGLHPAAAAIIGAALASTDPVLLRGLLRRPEIPSSARQGLRLESGLNDVVLLPIVLVAMELLGQEGGAASPDWARLALDMFILGPGAGVGVGVLAVATLDLVRRRIGIRRDYESLYSLGVAFAAFAAAEAVHGSGFLAVFAAGLTISWLDVELCDCFLEYGETTSEMALLFTFVLLGSSLIWSGLGILSLLTVLFAVLVVLFRPLAFSLALFGTRLEGKSRFLLSWFGPRGLSTLLLVLLPVFAGVEGSDEWFAICSLVVLFSVVVHGGSLMLLGRLPKHRGPAAVVEGEVSEVVASSEPAYLPAPQADEEIPAAPDEVEDDIPAPTPAPVAPVAAAPAPVQQAREYATLTLQPSPSHSAVAAAPVEVGERISLEQAQQLKQAGESLLLIDARSIRTYALEEVTAKGAVRLNPQMAVHSATNLNLPKTPG